MAQQKLSERSYIGFSVAMGQTTEMSSHPPFRGIALYDALMSLKPSTMTEYEWAITAGVNRGFFNDLKMKDTSPRQETLSKVLSAISKDVSDLTGAPAPNARAFKMEGASAERMSEDLPIFGTALGAPRVIEGEAIEQTTLNRGEIVTYYKRPTILNGRADVYGLVTVGSSMAPRFEEGEVTFVEKRHPRVGDDVVVYLRPMSELDDGETADAVLLKRLVRRTANYIELEQFTPPITFRIDHDRVLRVDRVLPWAELLA